MQRELPGQVRGVQLEFARFEHPETAWRQSGVPARENWADHRAWPQALPVSLALVRAAGPQPLALMAGLPAGVA